MLILEIKNFLKVKAGYQKEGSKRLKRHLEHKGFKPSLESCKIALKEVRKETLVKHAPNKNSRSGVTNRDVFIKAFKEESLIKNIKPTITKNKYNRNVLVIGDLHLPFCLEGYLEHCIEMYKLYRCNEVVFIGDIIDNHASSYHETDPDGMNAGQELSLAISQIQKWYEAFPKATIVIGNHDRLIMRKAYSSGLSRHWIRDYSEVLQVPNWKFQESIEIDGVLYIHGEGGTARTKMKNDLQSVVQGHLHTQCYIEWSVGAKFKIFGMQVGCGIDHTVYAMAYAKAGKKPAIACGVVLEGTTPINLLMNL